MTKLLLVCDTTKHCVDILTERHALAVIQHFYIITRYTLRLKKQS